jgi:two-component system response regulator ChvI
MTHTIALVDDDRNILISVSMALEAEGYAVRTYNDGEAGLEGLTTNTPDLAVLDVKMPRMNGTELLTRFRDHSDIPVIFLTSKDDEIDQVIGLRMGADDYITKPFSQRLLIERIKTLLRRQDTIKASATPSGAPDSQQYTQDKASEILKRGSLEMNEAHYSCTWQGQSMKLTVTEYLLIQSLAIEPGAVRSRDELIESAYEGDKSVDHRTVDSHIKRLRKKFKKQDPNFDNIETLYGVGYRYKQDS